MPQVDCVQFRNIFSGKNYETAEEEETRKMIFSTNLKQIEMHNYLYSKGKKTFQLGVNQFSDMVWLPFLIAHSYFFTNISQRFPLFSASCIFCVQKWPVVCIFQTNEEFRSTMNGFKRPNATGIPARASTYLSPLVKAQLPDSIDWRKEGYVTEVGPFLFGRRVAFSDKQQP